MGGPVGAGQSYLVGEQGPELFVPGMGGSIVPGGGINVTLQAGAFLGSSSDAREFARRVYSAIEEESKRRFTVPPTIRRGAAA
jgi:phage-related minor tail protein